MESGAELGLYEDDPGAEPDATIRVATEIAELPLIDLPALCEGEADLAAKSAALDEARRTGDDSAIRAAQLRRQALPTC